MEDKGKILFQLSFDSTQWRLDKDGRVINKLALRPGYTLINARLKNENTQSYYSAALENPFAKFTDTSTGTENILWYEDARSIAAKIRLARMFSVGGISIWRLGNIPDFNEPGDKKVYMNVWEEILKSMGKS